MKRRSDDVVRVAGEDDEMDAPLAGEPDVLLDVPRVAVEKIHLEVENLDAVVSLRCDVLGMVSIQVGAEVHLGTVILDLENVEAEAVLKVQLERVAAMVANVLRSAVENPELVGRLRGLTDEEKDQNTITGRMTDRGLTEEGS